MDNVMTETEIRPERGHCIKVALLSGSCERMENLCGIAKTIFPQWREAIWVEWGVHVPQIIPGQTDMGPGIVKLLTTIPIVRKT